MKDRPILSRNITFKKPLWRLVVSREGKHYTDLLVFSSSYLLLGQWVEQKFGKGADWTACLEVPALRKVKSLRRAVEK